MERLSYDNITYKARRIDFPRLRSVRSFGDVVRVEMKRVLRVGKRARVTNAET